jgi:hypothetical protein
MKMRKSLFLIAFICLAQACDRYPDPASEILSSYSFGYLNVSDKSFFAGEWVDDSISFRANKNSDTLNAPIRVLFEVIKGGGNITVADTYTNKSGIATTKWKLGSETFSQILRATTFDMSGKYLTHTDLIANAYRADKWDSCTTTPYCNMTGLVADTVNKFTLMVSNSALYRQGNRYYQWDQIINPLLDQPRTINIDGNGVLYVSTWKGEVVKSIDHGVSWQACTKPYPDRPYFIYFSLSNDNSLWVFDHDHPIRFSKDGGITWTDAGSTLSIHGFGDIFRLKDGSLIFHGSDCCSLYRSLDDGLTWYAITTPGYSQKLYVNDKDEIFIVTEESITAIYKSADYGATFTRVSVINPEWGTSFDNTFNKWGDFYYILIPGYGILKSYDLTNYTIYWRNSDLLTMFIDHNGVLIAKGSNMYTIYYRKNSN